MDHAMRLLALTAAWALLAATDGCTPASGKDGGPCKSNGLLAAFYCDDGLVCIMPDSPGEDTCGPCSPTDPRAACDELHVCQAGACVDCPSGSSDCANGAYGHPCLDGGACVSPLVCGPTDLCMPLDSGVK